MLLRLTTYLGLFLASLLAVGHAEAKKLGGEFTVSTEGYRPDVANLTDGGFVVIWRADYPYGVKAQRYDASGKKVGKKITVAKVSPELIHPVVAGLKSGGFVVAYEDDDSSGLGIYVQCYKANGKKAGKRKRANKYTPNDQFYPTVAGLTNGKFVVLWSSRDQDGAYAAIMGRMFSKSGSPKGGEFRADTTYPTSSHENPSVAAQSGGGFVVAWNAYVSIRAQRFSAAGLKEGDEFLVNPPEATGQLSGHAAGIASNGFVIARESVNEDGDGDGSGVFAQRYKGNAAPAGDKIVVNKETVGYQGNPDISGLGNGGFAIVWDGNNVVHGQFYNSKGKKGGKVFQVNKSAVPSQAIPAVAANGSKGFVVVWWSGGGIKGQRFNGK